MLPVVPVTAVRRPAVTLAIRNDIQRYGVERVLSGSGVLGSVTHSSDLGAAVNDAPDDDLSILVGALREVDEETLVELAGAARRGVRILLLVDTDEQGALTRIGQLAHLPAVGFLTMTDLNTATLPDVFAAAARGEMPMPPRLARALLAQTQGDAGAHTPRRPRLTPRESQVLELLGQGMSNRQIARRLGMSEHGAKRHVANILGKLGCTNRTGAVMTALRHGLYTA